MLSKLLDVKIKFFSLYSFIFGLGLGMWPSEASPYVHMIYVTCLVLGIIVRNYFQKHISLTIKELEYSKYK